MTRVLMVLLALIAIEVPARADQMASMQLAVALGDLLASEGPCDLSYDQAAIQTYIDGNVPPDEMGFASQLNMMTSGATFSMRDMSPSSLTAHCRATERSARHFGFIK